MPGGQGTGQDTGICKVEAALSTAGSLPAQKQAGIPGTGFKHILPPVPEGGLMLKVVMATLA